MKASPEGTHFLVPWLQKAILYDCRIKPRVRRAASYDVRNLTRGLQNISTTTGSKDLQMVSITLRVLSRPDLEHLPRIYKSLGQDYDERVLPSIGNEVLKSIVAQFDAAELITQREVVRAFGSYGRVSWWPTWCRCRHASVRTCFSARASSTLHWKMFPSPTSRSARSVIYGHEHSSSKLTLMSRTGIHAGTHTTERLTAGFLTSCTGCGGETDRPAGCVHNVSRFDPELIHML